MKRMMLFGSSIYWMDIAEYGKKGEIKPNSQDCEKKCYWTRRKQVDDHKSRRTKYSRRKNHLRK